MEPDPPVAPVRKRRASVYDVEEAPIKATEAAVAAEVERARVAFASPQPSEEGDASEVGAGSTKVGETLVV